MLRLTIRKKEFITKGASTPHAFHLSASHTGFHKHLFRPVDGRFSCLLFSC